MSYEEVLVTISVEAAEDLSASQYLMVALDSNGQITSPTGTGARMLGVLQDKPNAQGQVGSVAISGVTKVVSDGIAPAGTEASSSSVGKILGASIGNYVIGTTLEAATAADDIVNVLIEKYQKSA
jgi:hypothetical protein